MPFCNGNDPSRSSRAAPEWRALRHGAEGSHCPLSLKAGFAGLALSSHFCTFHYSPIPTFVKERISGLFPYLLPFPPPQAGKIGLPWRKIFSLSARQKWNLIPISFISDSTRISVLHLQVNDDAAAVPAHFSEKVHCASPPSTVSLPPPEQGRQALVFHLKNVKTPDIYSRSLLKLSKEFDISQEIFINLKGALILPLFRCFLLAALTVIGIMFISLSKQGDERWKPIAEKASTGAFAVMIPYLLFSVAEALYLVRFGKDRSPAGMTPPGPSFPSGPGAPCHRGYPLLPRLRPPHFPFPPPCGMIAPSCSSRRSLCQSKTPPPSSAKR